MAFSCVAFPFVVSLSGDVCAFCVFVCVCVFFVVWVIMFSCFTCCEVYVHKCVCVFFRVRFVWCVFSCECTYVCVMGYMCDGCIVCVCLSVFVCVCVVWLDFVCSESDNCVSVCVWFGGCFGLMPIAWFFGVFVFGFSLFVSWWVCLSVSV